MLLDEPLTNLDAKLRHDMRAELKRLHRQFGMTIVYATPDELEALSMGDEIAVMRDGRVVQQGTPDALYESPADLYVATKIGSPHMNTLEVKVADDGASLIAAFGRLPAPAVRGGLSAGEPLVLGVRPSDLRVARDSDVSVPPPCSKPSRWATSRSYRCWRAINPCASFCPSPRPAEFDRATRCQSLSTRPSYTSSAVATGRRSPGNRDEL